ncbi:MAG: hypothetical protein AB2747_05870 [Candidatus Thiodiazotropha taylori]
MATITLDIPNTDAADLREQLLCTVKDMSDLVAMSTNKDYGNENLLSSQFFSSLAQEIGALAEMANYIRDTDEVVS